MRNRQGLKQIFFVNHFPLFSNPIGEISISFPPLLINSGLESLIQILSRRLSRTLKRELATRLFIIQSFLRSPETQPTDAWIEDEDQPKMESSNPMSYSAPDSFKWSALTHQRSYHVRSILENLAGNVSFLVFF